MRSLSDDGTVSCTQPIIFGVRSRSPLWSTARFQSLSSDLRRSVATIRGSRLLTGNSSIAGTYPLVVCRSVGGTVLTLVRPCSTRSLSSLPAVSSFITTHSVLTFTWDVYIFVTCTFLTFHTGGLTSKSVVSSPSVRNHTNAPAAWCLVHFTVSANYTKVQFG